MRLKDPQLIDEAKQAMAGYQGSLSDDLRVLFDRFSFADAALKVVGVGSVGSVGTRA